MASFKVDDQNHIKSNHVISNEQFNQYEYLSDMIREPVKLIRKQTAVDVFIKLLDVDRGFGWVMISFPIKYDFWLFKMKSKFLQMSVDCKSSIRLISSYNLLNMRIKYMANANEFVSRLSLVDTSHISHEILLHLKQTFGFDHVILPESRQFDFSVPAATVYVPKHIRSLIDSIDIESLLTIPYEPILVHYDDENINNFIKKILGFYKFKQCYILPIVNQSKLVGFYLALNRSNLVSIDISLLSIINRQISSLIYRAATQTKIETTQQFYQQIVDYLSSIIIVFNSKLDIQFKNQGFDQFFKKDYQNFKRCNF